MATSARAVLAKLGRAAQAGLVTVPMAAEILEIPRRAAAMKLAALARRGWVQRARRGLYLILPLEVEPGHPTVAEDPWVLAQEAFAPCYIGGWSAAEYWGMTEQLFQSTLVVTAAHVRSRSLRLLGHTFRLFQVPRARIRGGTLVWRGAGRVLVSDREHTIVDGLCHPELCGGIRHLVEIMREYGSTLERDVDHLTAVTRDAGSGAAWKRLGYLAERLWPDASALLDKAATHLTTGNVKLDPALRNKGRLVRRWRLWANLTIERGGEDV